MPKINRGERGKGKIIIVIIITTLSLGLGYYIYVDLQDDIEIQRQIEESRHMSKETNTAKIIEIKKHILQTESDLQMAYYKLNEINISEVFRTEDEKEHEKIKQNMRIDSIKTALHEMHIEFAKHENIKRD